MPMLVCNDDPAPPDTPLKGPSIAPPAAFMFGVSHSLDHVVAVHAQVAEQVAEMLLEEALSSSSTGELWNPTVIGNGKICAHESGIEGSKAILEYHLGKPAEQSCLLSRPLSMYENMFYYTIDIHYMTH